MAEEASEPGQSAEDEPGHAEAEEAGTEAIDDELEAEADGAEEGSDGEQLVDAEGEERSYIFEERLKRGGELRLEGNQLFGAGDMAGAVRVYRRALHHAEFEEMSYNFELQDEHRALVDKARLDPAAG